MAARASLATGLVLWLYTLALPPMPKVGGCGWPGPFDPLRLLGMGHARRWSMGCCGRWGQSGHVSCGLGAARGGQSAAIADGVARQVSDLSDLKDLTASFIGHERAEHVADARRGMAIDRRSAQRAQTDRRGGRQQRPRLGGQRDGGGR
jgi:hypothetical protein